MNFPILSIRQPWAWLVVAGFKDFENRSRLCRVIGPVWVHAGLQHDASMPLIREWCADTLNIVVPDELTTGAIVGQMHVTKGVTDIESEPRSIWRNDNSSGYALDVTKARQCEPLLMKGQQGFWRSDETRRVVFT